MPLQLSAPDPDESLHKVECFPPLNNLCKVIEVGGHEHEDIHGMLHPFKPIIDLVHVLGGFDLLLLSSWIEFELHLDLGRVLGNTVSIWDYQLANAWQRVMPKCGKV